MKPKLQQHSHNSLNFLRTLGRVPRTLARSQGPTARIRRPSATGRQQQFNSRADAGRRDAYGAVDARRRRCCRGGGGGGSRFNANDVSRDRPVAFCIDKPGKKIVHLPFLAPSPFRSVSERRKIGSNAGYYKRQRCLSQTRRRLESFPALKSNLKSVLLRTTYIKTPNFPIMGVVFHKHRNLQVLVD